MLQLTRRLARVVSFAAALGPALALGVAAGAMAESVEYDLTTTAFTSSADYSQPGFSPAETHDGNIEAAAPPYDGWAVDPFEGDPHQILWSFVAGETEVDAIQLINVYSDNEVLHHFQLYYTTDSNPSLASTFNELTGLQMVLNTSGDGATIVGSEVQVTSTTAITTGEYRLTFTPVDATAIKVRTFPDSGTGNGNFVLSEISMRSSDLCTNVMCAVSGQCRTVGTCDPATGMCSSGSPVADGTSCDDGDAATVSDQCTAGFCGGTNLCDNVICSASDQCHAAGTCDPASGLCSYPALADGTSCDDGDAATVSDQCTAGFCAGTDLCTNVMCAVSGQCRTVGTCDPATGMCSSGSPVADGTSCDDGDAATVSDQCTAGFCGGTNLCDNVICSASDQCHAAGICDLASGLCSYPALADGTSCDDGDAATVSDQCTAGVCGGTDLCANVTCLASDQCHEAGTCEPTTGLCSDPVLQGSASCDDGDVTTVNDQCMAGLCVGDDLCANVICSVPPDQCHVAGSCNPLTGACSYPNVADGERCDDGDPATPDMFCVEGVCEGLDKCEGVTCVPSDQCHLVGVCDVASGLCSDPVAETGMPCNDGDVTTVLDQCTAGVCGGTNLCANVTCSASDQCHGLGSCDYATGLCSYPALADGTSCDDGDAATVSDQCTAGLCGGTNSSVPLLSPFGIAIFITCLLVAATRRWRSSIT